ncbi:hypothetical protein Tco_0262358 [Tanacetum coccineum]
MEEYIRLEEEKARKHRKVFNWETAKYGKIWYDEDVYDLRSVETEFPATVFNDKLTSEEALSCEPTVSSLNDEIDFRISFDESDDEDYTSDKDNDDDKVDIKHSSGDLSVKPLLDVINSDDGAYCLPADNPECIFNFVIEYVFPGCLYGVSKTHGYGVLTLWTLSSLYFQHSLYGVFVKRIQRIGYRYQYGVSRGMDMAYQLPV